MFDETRIKIIDATMTIIVEKGDDAELKKFPKLIGVCEKE